MRDLCNFFRGNFNCNDVPATHQGHVLGVPRELAVEDEVNPGVVHLPGILQRGHVEAVLYCTVLYCTVLYCTVQVRRTVRVLDRFFRGDGGTAFLLTADHGMTDWGAHGTGADM